MSWLRAIDLYKAIILGSILLAAAAGIWAWNMKRQVADGRIALAAARTPNGVLQQIGLLQKQIENHVANQRHVVRGSPLDYFAETIYTSASPGSDFKRADFIVGSPNEVKNTRLGTKDISVTIEFKRGGREAFPLPRPFLHAVVLNCEQKSQIWKLRDLRIRNKDLKDALAGSKAPPPETADEWLVESMTFACRQPDKAR
jgi:hypothetical protein